MKKYYFIAGKFQADGMARKYDKDIIFITVNSASYDNALNISNEYVIKIFGCKKYKDLWYGEKLYTWEIQPYTEYLFNREYKKYNNCNIINL